MKGKLRIIIGLLALAVSQTYAAHQFHSWRLISEGTDDRGRKVCTWECRQMAETHHAVTKGYGYCGRP